MYLSRTSLTRETNLKILFYTLALYLYNMISPDMHVVPLTDAG